jgi:clan AA aspartic protease
MIKGIVTAQREAILRLPVRSTDGKEHEYDSVVDTGYNGWLTLPPSIITALGYRWQRFGHATLADGSESVFNVYEGVVLWDGQLLTIDVDELDADSLVGMSLMYGFELLLPVLDGAAFTLRSLAGA